MTLSVQQVWSAYRNEGQSVNHDGTWELPENVRDLPDPQVRKWMAVTNLGNQHATESIEPVRKRL